MRTHSKQVPKKGVNMSRAIPGCSIPDTIMSMYARTDAHTPLSCSRQDVAMAAQAVAGSGLMVKLWIGIIPYVRYRRFLPPGPDFIDAVVNCSLNI